MATAGGLTRGAFGAVLLGPRAHPAVAPARAPSEALAIDEARPGSYQWWYFDATSDDGEHTLVAIFFVGSVFSPWYARRLAAGERATPRDHAAVNVALYRRGRRAPLRWAFTERAARECVGRAEPELRVGRSALYIGRGGYELALDETPPFLTVPLPVRGRVRFEPIASSPVAAGLHLEAPLAIDEAGAHRWLPAAPRCRVTVELDAPALRFRGTGYHDVNHGDVPLGASFARWTWSRAHEPDRTRIDYDRVLRDGSRRVLSLELPHGAAGREPRDGADAPVRVADRVAPAHARRARGAWGLGEPAELRLGDEPLAAVKRVDASPFYARYTAQTATGAPVVAEHLDLDRFAASWVRTLLPFKARRVR